MIYMRGQAADYDGWRARPGGLGLGGRAAVLQRHEDHHAGADALHGAGGEWRVERQRVSWPILDAVREAAAEIGIPKIDDFNRGDNEGAAYFEVNQRRGRRWSAASAFSNRSVAAEPRSGDRRPCRAAGLRGRRAVACARRRGVGVEARARGEIVLAAGAIGSPHLLELSGIGRPEVAGRPQPRYRPCVARGRREPAGSPAAAHSVPHLGRAHAQPRHPARRWASSPWRSNMRSRDAGR